jgi:hypothetical protein
MLRRGELEQVIWLKGTPTIMVGRIEDPHFEEHLREGPYVVFDDAALDVYKNDPRVHFVPGHPVLRTAMPELLQGMGVAVPGQAIMKLQKLERWGMHATGYGSSLRLLAPLGAAALAFAGVLAGSAALARKS